MKLNSIPAWSRLAVLAAILAILGGITPMMAQCGSSGGEDAGYYQSCSTSSNGGDVGAFALAYQDCDCASLGVLASTTTTSTDIFAGSAASSSYGASSTFGMSYVFASGSYYYTGGGWSYDDVAGCNSGSD